MTAINLNISFTGFDIPDFAVKSKDFKKWLARCPLEPYRIYFEDLEKKQQINPFPKGDN